MLLGRRLATRLGALPALAEASLGSSQASLVGAQQLCYALPHVQSAVPPISGSTRAQGHHLSLRSFAADAAEDSPTASTTTSGPSVPQKGRSRYQLPPCSLELPAHELPDTEQEESAVTTSGGPLRRLLWLLGYHSDEAITVRAASNLYEAVITQTDANALHNAVDMPPVFYSRWCLMMLHIWMVLVRLRADGSATTKLRQELYDLFQEDVEVRVRLETPISVNKWLVELEKDFYGSALALDKSLQGEVEMWEQLHRNVYGGDATKVEAARRLSVYVQRELECLQLTSSDALIRGNIRFSPVPDDA